MLESGTIDQFRGEVKAYYKAHGRHDLLWRQPEVDGSFDAYKIMVSEIMLQQTQVSRVIPKYHEFLTKFPTIATVAEAPLSAVLLAWSGLGYNRRAKFLQQAAQQIHTRHAGKVPQTLAELVALPGIGHNTAAAILVYAFNQPVVFIETNIRTVFIHHFFRHRQGVADKEILELVHETLPTERPREWYWSLMDYGAYLKQTVGNLNRTSQSYSKQSTFEGSRRQIRGRIIQLLGVGQQTSQQLHDKLADERVDEVLQELLAEGLIRQQNGTFTL